MDKGGENFEELGVRWWGVEAFGGLGKGAKSPFLWGVRGGGGFGPYFFWLGGLGIFPLLVSQKPRGNGPFSPVKFCK